MEAKPVSYLVLINGPLIVPLLTLIETLEKTTPIPPKGGVQTCWDENGPSAAIIVLAAFIFESTINGIRSGQKDDHRKMFPAKYFAEICQDSDLCHDMREVFSVRDVIVHAHPWGGDITWNKANDQIEFVKQPELDGTKYGDDKFWKHVLNPGTLCSKRLGVNLLPTCLWRRDAYLILKTVRRALMALDSRYPCYRDNVGVGYLLYDFRGEKRTFYDIVEALSDLPQTC